MASQRKRDFNRQMMVVDDIISVSLQNLPAVHNYVKLCQLRNQTRSLPNKNLYTAMIDIHSLLMLPSDYKRRVVEPDELAEILIGVKECQVVGIVEFSIAYEIFLNVTGVDYTREDEKRTYFRDCILNPDHGLFCFIYQHDEDNKYIILKNKQLNMPKMIKTLAGDGVSKKIRLDYNITRNIIQTVNTEYDRKVVRGLLSQVLSKQEMLHVGIKSQNAIAAFEEVSKATMIIMNLQEEAEQFVIEKISGKITKLKEGIRKGEDRNILLLSEKRAREHNDHVAVLKEQLQAKENILQRDSAYSRQLFNQAARRYSNKKVVAERIQKRSTGAGAPSLLDSEDEDFVADSIEVKSSYHGRRHDAVMYTNHRIKQKDLLSIANYSLFKRGKKLLKSAKTVMLRSRPHNKRTIEGKKHCGKWLFCTKKTPKSETVKNESIHFNRAFVKCTRQEMYSTVMKSYCLDISMDDKAYVRPGTDVGFRITKNSRILDVTDENAARKLPEHDFPVTEMCQTPSSFRLMTWKTEIIDEKEVLVKCDDQSFVEIRPKYFVSSSGSVWASSLLELVYSYPDRFILNPSDECSLIMKSFFIRIHDTIFYFILTTTDDDLASYSTGEEKFVKYEKGRLLLLLNQMKEAIDIWQQSKEMSATDRTISLVSYQSLLNLKSKCKDLYENVGAHDGNDEFKSFYSSCKQFLQSISGFVPKLKPFIAEYTDAGPGVGVSNHQVCVRFVELCILQHSESRIRLHRAPGDSGQNEVERTNSYIGDSLVDGAALGWQHYDAFHGLEEEEIDAMSYDDMQSHLSMITEKNAWAVAQEICSRIDDEPGPSGGFLKSVVSRRMEDQFFQNATSMMTYIHASSSTKQQIPGHGYFKKILEFQSLHCRSGKYFIDYQRGSCNDTTGKLCELCTPRTMPVDYPKFCQPFPDYDRLPQFHYLSYEKLVSSGKNLNREVDDYQPKVQLKTLFASGEITSKKHDAIDKFSAKYIVPVDVLKDTVSNLELKALLKKKRNLKAANQRNLEKAKAFKDYNWEELVVTNDIRKKTVSILDKYLEYFSMDKRGKKEDKVKRIILHVHKDGSPSSEGSETINQVEEEEEEREEDGDDIVVATYDSDSDINNSDEEDDAYMQHMINVIEGNQPTRSGRLPKPRYF